MALTNCKECNGKLSSEAIACPHCGHPSGERNIAIVMEPGGGGGFSTAMGLGVILVGFLALILLVMFLF